MARQNRPPFRRGAASTRPYSPEGKCRDCGAPIYWATTPLGKKRPYDKVPSARGGFVLFKIAGSGELRVERLAAGQRPPPGGHPRTCHFDTCTEKQNAQRAAPSHYPQHAQAAA